MNAHKLPEQTIIVNKTQKAGDIQRVRQNLGLEWTGDVLDQHSSLPAFLFVFPIHIRLTKGP